MCAAKCGLTEVAAKVGMLGELDRSRGRPACGLRKHVPGDSDETPESTMATPFSSPMGTLGSCRTPARSHSQDHGNPESRACRVAPETLEDGVHQTCCPGEGNSRTTCPEASTPAALKTRGFWGPKREGSDRQAERLRHAAAGAMPEAERQGAGGQPVDSSSSQIGLSLEPEALVFEHTELCIPRSAVVRVRNR